MTLSEVPMTGSVRKAVFKGASWITGLQLASKVLEIGFVAVLARLLQPADFGVIAGSTIFIQFAQMLVEIGIGATLVQLKDLDDRDIRTAGTLVFVNGLVCCLLTQLIAPSIGEFLHIAAVTPVLRVLSILFLIQAFGVVSESILVRRLEAHRALLAQFAARIVGTGVIGIACAAMGFGYWSLVIATLAEAALKSGQLLWIVRPPLLPSFDKVRYRRLMTRGSAFSVSQLINFVATRADNAIVGRFMEAAALGLYSRAYNLMSVPADLYGRIAERLVFPAFSLFQNDPPRLRRAFLEGVELTAALGLPISILLFVLAPDVIKVILGPKWTAVMVPFAVLAIATYGRLGAKIASSLQRAMGAKRALVFCQTVYAGMVIGGCLATVHYGLVMLSWAVSASVVVFYFVINISACRMIRVRLMDFVAAHRPGGILGVGTAVISWSVATLARLAGLPSIVVLLMTGAAVTVAGGLIVMLGSEWLVGSTLAQIAGIVRVRLGRLRQHFA